MVEAETLSFLFVGSAFLAGILSFLSPCVLPLVPVYLGYLTGSTAQEEAGGATMSRSQTLLHASAFIGGFAGVFVLLGASVGFVGYVLLDAVPLFLRIGGILIILMGLHLIGIIRIPFLYQEKRMQFRHAGDPNVGSSALLGVVFGAGWTPCVGPVLGTILGMAYASATAWQGALLLAVYSIGLGIPFLLSALGVERLLDRIRSIGPWLRRIEMASGVLLLVVGVLIFTNRFAVLNTYLIRMTPPWLLQYL